MWRESYSDIPDVHAKTLVASAVCSLISTIVCMATESEYREGHESNEQAIVTAHWMLVFASTWAAVLCHKHKVGSMAFYLVTMSGMMFFGILLGEGTHEHGADIAFNVIALVLYVIGTGDAYSDYISMNQVLDADDRLPATETENALG